MIIRVFSHRLPRQQAAKDSGALRLGGAFGDLGGAAIVFKCGDASEVEEFAKGDPYVKGGLVTDWNVREWTVVIGEC